MLQDLDKPTEYPYVKKLSNGFKAVLSKSASLPGIYTSIFQAERGIEKYEACGRASKAAKRKAGKQCESTK